MRDALANAADGDTIDLTSLTCATISLSSGALAVSARDLDIVGPDEDMLAIDAAGSSQVLVGAALGTLAISGLTIENGYTTSGVGGCIDVEANLSLTRTVVSGCVANGAKVIYACGGGVAVSGNATLVSSTISGNSLTGLVRASGGGLCASGDVEASGSLIDGNQIVSLEYQYNVGGYFVLGRSSGGGLYASYGVTLSSTRISANSATALGFAYAGGVYAGAGATVDIEDSIIDGNTLASTRFGSYGAGLHAGGGYYTVHQGVLTLMSSSISNNTIFSELAEGGGIFMFGTIEAMDSTVSDNRIVSTAQQAFCGGGGIFLKVADHGYPVIGLDLDNSTISGNTVECRTADELALGWGGGIAGYTYLARIRNSTIAFNSAQGKVGGIALASLELTSSIVANNTAADDPSTNDIGWRSPLETRVVAGSNNIVMTAGADFVLPADTLHVDPLLQPLADNGGPTKTHALAQNSPAIDAGINPRGFSFDQRGTPYVRERGNAPDIGAFELQIDRIFADGFDKGG